MKMNQTFLSLNLFASAATACFVTLSSPQTAHAIVLGFESGDFSNWEISEQGKASVKTSSSFGNITPTEGKFQALIENSGTDTTPVSDPLPLTLGGEVRVDLETFLFGGGNNIRSEFNSPTEKLTEGSAIKTSFNANASDTLSFDANFLTNEGSNNDVAFLTIDDGNTVEILQRINEVNTANLSGSPTQFNQQTGYQSFNNIYTFTTTATYTLGFAIVDQSSQGVDSGLLIDNVQINSGTAQAVPFDVSTNTGIVVLLGWVASIAWRRHHRYAKAKKL